MIEPMPSAVGAPYQLTKTTEMTMTAINSPATRSRIRRGVKRASI